MLGRKASEASSSRSTPIETDESHANALEAYMITPLPFRTRPKRRWQVVALRRRRPHALARLALRASIHTQKGASWLGPRHSEEPEASNPCGQLGVAVSPSTPCASSPLLNFNTYLPESSQ